MILLPSNRDIILFKGKQMKRLLIVLTLIVIVMSSASAQGFLGTEVNWLGVGMTGGYESEHFGVDGAMTLPVFSYVGGIVEYFEKRGTAEETEFPLPLYLVQIPLVSTSAYWKIVDNPHFGLNLGLKLDMLFSFEKKGVAFVGTYGPMLSLDWDISDDFCITLRGTCPISLILDLIDKNLSEQGFGYFKYSNKSSSEFEEAFLLLFAIPGSVVNLGFKWTLC